ncbi:MAG: AzlD domain-containing protein [Acidimicrobiia bacterium]
MSDLALVLVVAVITFATRIAFLIRPRPVPGGPLGRFLEVFPLALFMVIAVTGLVAPEGSLAVTPALAGAVGGVVGGVLFRRNLWAVMLLGAVAFYVTRAMVG